MLPGQKAMPQSDNIVWHMADFLPTQLGSADSIWLDVSTLWSMYSLTCPQGLEFASCFEVPCLEGGEGISVILERKEEEKRFQKDSQMFPSRIRLVFFKVIMTRIWQLKIIEIYLLYQPLLTLYSVLCTSTPPQLVRRSTYHAGISQLTDVKNEISKYLVRMSL